MAIARTLLVLLAFFAGAVPAGAGQADFAVGTWSNAERRQTATGAPLLCAAGIRLEDDALLVLARSPDGRLALMASAPDWDLAAGRPLEATLVIDDIHRMPVRAEASQAGRLVVRAEGRRMAALLDRIKGAKRLRVVGGDGLARSFPLDGADAAVATMEGCVRTAKTLRMVREAEEAPAEDVGDDSLAAARETTKVVQTVLPVVQKLQTLFMQMMGKVEELDTAALATFSGKVDPESGAARMQDAAKGFKDLGLAYKDQLAALKRVGETQPDLKMEMIPVFAHFTSLLAQAGNFLKDSAGAFKVAAQGDKGALKGLALGRVDRTVAILEAENMLIKMGQKSTATDHPEYHLQDSIINSNQAMINLFEVFKDTLANGPSLPTEKDDLVQAHLDVARRSNDTGRRLAQGILQEFKRGLAAGDDPKGIDSQAFISAIESYEDSFSLEDDIDDLIGSVSMRDEGVRSAPEQLSLLQPLVTQRVGMRVRRASLIATAMGQ